MLADEPPAAQRRQWWDELEVKYRNSPIHPTLGLTLRVVDAGHVVVEFDGAMSAANRSGEVSGGALATMIDSAVVQAVRSLCDPADRVATVRLDASYVRPAKCPGRLSARGSVEHVGRSLAIGQGRVVNDEGTLVALGNVTVSVRRAANEGSR